MSALIDGEPWSAGCVANATYDLSAGSLYVAGEDQPLDSGHSEVVAFSVGSTVQPGQPARPLMPGTYQIGGPPLPGGVDPYALVELFCKPVQAISQDAACSVWEAAASFGSGTITITDVTQTTAKGTFVFTLRPLPGGSTLATNVTKAVTNGRFDVTF